MKRGMWINVLIGIWLIIAPFALTAPGLSAAWAGNDIILGVLLIVASWWILAATIPATGVAWFEIVCSIWLIAAPFVLRYSHMKAAALNDAICGVVALVVTAAVTQAMTRRPTTA